MSRVIEFSVPGAPVGKGRPKFARRGKFVQTYTPEKTASYESLVKLAATQAMKGDSLIHGPVSLTLQVCFQVPKSWSKKKQAAALAGELWPTVKPDADNVAKAIGDAINAVVYVDDSQVVELFTKKTYSETPGVRVIVEEI